MEQVFTNLRGGGPISVYVRDGLLAGKQGECVRGAKVTLTSKAEQKTLTTETNFLVDFEFKGLVVGDEYTLRAEYNGYLPKEVIVKTDASVNLGELVLTAG